MQSEAPTPQQVAAAGERFWTALAKHPHSYNVFAKYYSFLVGSGRVEGWVQWRVTHAGCNVRGLPSAR